MPECEGLTLKLNLGNEAKDEKKEGLMENMSGTKEKIKDRNIMFARRGRNNVEFSPSRQLGEKFEKKDEG